jgi:hypothetical protein
VRALGRAVPGPAALERTLAALPPGQFLLVDGPAGSTATFVPVSRGTAHRRHRVKYACAEVPGDRRFLFRGDAGAVVAEAGQILQFSDVLDAVPDAVLDGHARRGDFSRWVRDVFGDRELAAALRKIETRRAEGELGDLRSALRQLIAVRYGPPAGG